MGGSEIGGVGPGGAGGDAAGGGGMAGSGAGEGGEGAAAGSAGEGTVHGACGQLVDDLARRRLLCEGARHLGLGELTVQPTRDDGSVEPGAVVTIGLVVTVARDAPPMRGGYFPCVGLLAGSGARVVGENPTYQSCVFGATPGSSCPNEFQVRFDSNLPSPTSVSFVAYAAVRGADCDGVDNLESAVVVR